MTPASRLSAETNLNIARARDDSAALWRQLLSALGKQTLPEPTAPLPLKLNGRYCAGGGSEFEGQSIHICARGLHIEGRFEPSFGAWCVANLQDIGIVEGPAVDVAPAGFVLGVVAPAWRLQRLATRLAWRLRRDGAEVDERRSSARIEMNRAKALLTAADGRETPCEIFDLSDGGAALHLGAGALYYWDDQPVALDGRPARVLRHFPGGLVIRFESDISPA